MLVAEAAHLDVHQARQLAAQELHVDARSAVDVGRIFVGQQQRLHVATALHATFEPRDPLDDALGLRVREAEAQSVRAPIQVGIEQTARQHGHAFPLRRSRRGLASDAIAQLQPQKEATHRSGPGGAACEVDFERVQHGLAASFVLAPRGANVCIEVELRHRARDAPRRAGPARRCGSRHPAWPASAPGSDWAGRSCTPDGYQAPGSSKTCRRR